MIEKLEEIAKIACEKSNVALYDLEIKNTQRGRVVLVSITKVNAITVEDCQQVSRYLSDDLDVRDMIADRYFLEVSSPGVERNLRLKKHYTSAINETIKITFLDDDKKRTENGKLMEVHPDYIILQYPSDEQQKIPFQNIKKAKTVFEFKK